MLFRSYCWTQGLKGGKEVSTCLARFVRDHLSDHQHVVFWSDNCSGQNKNRHMMAALSQLTASRPEGSIIKIKFFETGHAHMEADSMHAKIERDSKFREVATPGDWIQIFQAGRGGGEGAYIVRELTHEDFLDYSAVASRVFVKSDCLKGISKKHVIRFEREGEVVLISWADCVLGPLQPVRYRGQGGQLQWQQYEQLPKAFESRLPLPSKRYEDSRSLIPCLANQQMARLYFDSIAELVVTEGRGDNPAVPDIAESATEQTDEEDDRPLSQLLA